jgi:predicted kinase
MTEHPLHPAAGMTLGTVPTWTPAGLLAALAGQTEGVTAALAARFESWAARTSPVVETAVLLDAADREAACVGNYYVRCEHLLLGMQRLLGDDDALTSGRTEYQRLRGEQAFGAYLKLRPLPRPEGAPRPCAVAVGGVPGAGKSTLAEGLARELRAPVFSMDWQMGALVPFGALRPDNQGPLPKMMTAAAMARQLQLGQDAILDVLLASVDERQCLREIAEGLDAAFVGVECQCSDEQVHRSRVEGRSRGIPGWAATVTWEHVQRMRERWEPWPEPHIVVDSAVEPPGMVLRRVVRAVQAERAGAPPSLLHLISVF